MNKKKSQPRLSAKDWEQAALEMIRDEGIAALAVEPLARRLGVTKGSFYWHFKNRNALLEAALVSWEMHGTADVIKNIKTEPTPKKQLIRLFHDVILDLPMVKLHVALTAGSVDPLVKGTLDRVTNRRIKFLKQCYRNLGLSAKEANYKALLAYSIYLGMIQMANEFPHIINKGKQFDEMMDTLIKTMIPD